MARVAEHGGFVLGGIKPGGENAEDFTGDFKGVCCSRIISEGYRDRGIDNLPFVWKRPLEAISGII